MWRPAALRRRRGDEGFSILEVTISLALIATVMAASTTFFLKSMTSSKLLEQRQGAGVLLTQALEQARAVPPSKLVLGRTKVAMAAQRTLPTHAELGTDELLPVVTSLLPVSTAVAAVVPLSSVSVYGGTEYTVRTFVDGCVRALTANAVCLSKPSVGSLTDAVLKGGLTVSPTARLMLRVTVSVSWRGRSSACDLSGSRCEVLGSTLVDIGSDPTFPSETT